MTDILLYEIENRFIWWILLRIGNTNTTITTGRTTQMIKFLGRSYVRSGELY